MYRGFQVWPPLPLSFYSQKIASFHSPRTFNRNHVTRSIRQPRSPPNIKGLPPSLVLVWSNNGPGAIRRYIRVSKRMGELAFICPGWGEAGVLLILRIVGLAANVLSLGLHSLACFQFGQAEERDRFEEADRWLNMVEEWLDGEADILRIKLKQSRNVVLIFQKLEILLPPTGSAFQTSSIPYS